MLETLEDTYNPDGAPSRKTAPPPGAPCPQPDHREDAAGSILHSALKYLDEGWRIFPVDEEKRPANAHGALGPYIESESDAGRFWAKGGKFGIAAATGQGLLVLDVDLPAGPESITRLETELGPLPPTRTSRTPTGGAQLLFRVPASFSPRNTQGALAPGIDTRCHSGYIVLPPSRGLYQKDIGNGPILIDGRWEWAFTDDFAELPAAWRDRVAEVSGAPREEDGTSRSSGGSSPGIDAWLAGAHEPGKWHTNVLALTAHLVAKGRSDREILAFAYELTCPGYTLEQTRDEMLRMIEGARRKGFAEAPSGSNWINAADVMPKNVEFLWPPRIVRHRINLVAGLGGVGKDIFLCDTAARVTTGRDWPDGAGGCAPGRVGIITSEDEPGDTVVPRLLAAGADLSRVQIWTGSKRPTPQDIAGLDLLIVSPLIDLMESGKDVNRERDVREFLGTWQHSAEGAGCTVIGIAHLNKKGDLTAVQRILGAVGIANFMRSVWLIQRDDEDPEERLFLPLKGNLLPDAVKGLRYRLIQDGPWQQSVRCDFLGATDKRPDDVMAASGRQSAGAWLTAYLRENGEVLRSDVMSAAKEAGYKEKTVQQAKDRNPNIKEDRRGFPARSYWRLAE